MKTAFHCLLKLDSILSLIVFISICFVIRKKNNTDNQRNMKNTKQKNENNNLISLIKNCCHIVLSICLLLNGLYSDDLELIAIFEGNPDCDSIYFGRHCLFLGDINDDGYGDIAITSQVGNDTSACPYTIQFYWGGADFDTIPDMILTRDSSLYYFGQTFGTNGDVNGDGVPDLVVGTHGGFYILLGGQDFDTEFDFFIPETSNVSHDYVNRPIRIISDGDFNGDGINDIITSNRYHIAHPILTSGNGIVRVYYGQNSFFDTTPDWSYSPEWSDSSIINSNRRVRLDDVGDINGDNYSDLVVSSSFITPDDTVRIFLGSELPDTIPSYKFNLDGIIAVGNIDGDFYDDIFIQTYGAGSDDLIIFGGIIIDSNLIHTFPITNIGGQPILYDINKDDYDDLILSDWNFFAGFGLVSILLGSTNIDAEVDAELYGHEGSYFGVSTVGVGDINIDGRPDILIGEFEYPVGWHNYGRAYLFAGDTTMTVGIADDELSIPFDFIVFPIFPNPFNGSTTLHFTLNVSKNIRIVLYDLTGRFIKEIINKNVLSGNNSIKIDMTNQSGTSLATGIYFLQVNTNTTSKTQKLVYLK